MTMDMSRYLGLFISEASDHLEALGRDLVQLEREGTASVVDPMFRHAHSVKGMASSMGFEEVRRLLQLRACAGPPSGVRGADIGVP